MITNGRAALIDGWLCLKTTGRFWAPVAYRTKQGVVFPLLAGIAQAQLVAYYEELDRVG